MRRVSRVLLATCLAAATTLVAFPGMARAGAAATNVGRSISLDPTPADMEGAVRAPSGVHACERHVPVAVFKRVNGKWMKKGSGMTDNTGFYKIPPGESSGYWRSVARAVSRTKNGNIYNCLRAVSPVAHVP
jgi:hypothetical protein